MKYLKPLLALTLSALANVAHADFSSTWTVTNDYDFRGASQTALEPALQFSVDYSHSSGLYAGLWFSNVKFCDDNCDLNGDPKGDLERDIYAGYTNTIGEDWTYDVGAVRYTYNQHVLDFHEFYASIAYKWLKAKYYYAPDFGGDTNNGNASASAITLDATVPLPADFSLLAHIGNNSGDALDQLLGDSYMDYSIGVGYTIKKFDLALKFVDTDTSDSKGTRTTDDVFNNEGRVVMTIATTLPW